MTAIRAYWIVVLGLLLAACGGAAGSFPAIPGDNAPAPVVTLPPAFANTPPTTATEGVPYAWQASAADPEGGVVTFDLVLAPTGMTTTAAGFVTWTPEAGVAAGDHDVTLIASDGEDTATLDWSISVAAVALAHVDPEIIAAAPLSANAGQLFAYQVVVTGTPAPVITMDPLATSWTDGASIITQGLPGWLAFDGVDTFSGTPASSDTGMFVELGVVAANGSGLDATEVFMITVAGIVSSSTPPVITSTPPLVSAVTGKVEIAAGQAFSYTIVAIGTPAPTMTLDPMNFYAVPGGGFGIGFGLPSWLHFDGVDTFSGSPTAADVGMSGNVGVIAANGLSPDATQLFQFTVIP